MIAGDHTCHEIVEDLPRLLRGSISAPEAYGRAERQWGTALALFGERRFDEAAAAFVRVAEILSPTLATGFREEFLQARALAYSNSAIAFFAGARVAEGRARLRRAFERDTEAKLEIARALELLADPISGR